MKERPRQVARWLRERVELYLSFGESETRIGCHAYEREHYDWSLDEDGRASCNECGEFWFVTPR